MPRIADQHLEAKIVRAALRLWRIHGAKSLTLRSVARVAGTTTTTVYKRFSNKDALLVALAEMVQAKITAKTTSAATIEQAYREFLAFVEKHPREYSLLWGPGWPQLYGPKRAVPIRDWMLDKFAARFGGRPKDYARAYYTLFLLVHGTASLMSVGGDRRVKAEIRRSCLVICDRLVANIQVLKKPSTENANGQSR
jgi:AcrR family transcriptional regulator